MKTSLLFTFFLALGFSAMAQDTVPFGQLPMNYLIRSDYPMGSNGTFGRLSNFGEPASGGEYGVCFHTNDSVTVYGLAACVFASLHPNAIDTSFKQCQEYLRLYLPEQDSLRWVRQNYVHIKHTPVSYYVDFLTKTVAMYERYFEPIKVCDTFYAGMTDFLEKPVMRWNEADSIYIREIRCPTMAVRSLIGASYENEKYWMSLHSYNNSIPPEPLTEIHIWVSGEKRNQCTLIFPILVPPDTTVIASDTISQHYDTINAGDTIVYCDTIIVRDTIYVGGDTLVIYDTVVNYDTILGIDDHTLLGRLTGVMPNPATETAKVVSSFGLTMVEAFNMAGEKVHTLRLPDTPLTATLDVRRWPSGTYLLRIHTPQGTAVKKLVVN